MITGIKAPVAEMNAIVPTVIGRFNFERPTRIVGRSNTDDSEREEFLDPDIHDGTIVSSHGYARLALHKPTQTICLITSKSSLNLQGEMLDDGSIQATQDGLRQSYIVSAYRADHDRFSPYRHAPQIRRDLKRFNENLAERSEKHFTLYGASFEKLGEGAQSVDNKFNDEFEIYTNGRLGYTLQRIEKKGKQSSYEVKFYAPTRRKDGSFLPVSLKQKGLSLKFANVSKKIAICDDYASAHNQMMHHWQTMSSKLWDEKSIFESEGRWFRSKKFAADAFNYVADNGLRVATVTLLVGLTLGLVNPKYGIISGIVAAIIHTAMDMIVDEGYVLSKEQIRRVNDAKRKAEITAYGIDENAADHFKIQTRENIAKLCAKMDMERFKAEDFVFLRGADSGMLLDHDKPLDGFRPSSLRAHLLAVHQRGFSSSCFLPDPYTRVDLFQSGLVRMMHEKDSGEVVIYARYRPDVCLVDSLRLPTEKTDRLGSQIWKLSYDRKRPDFHNAFKREAKVMSLDEMIADVEQNILFKREGDAQASDKAVLKRSLGAIRRAFERPEDATSDLGADGAQCEKKAPLYMSGRAVHPPYLKALAA